ncbi:MAG: hypothetical protein ACOY5S_04470, partial [Pseudomonadota bacterium]
TGRVSVLAVVAAPGCALRDNDSANRINQLPDYEFAQLDAHNSSRILRKTGEDVINCFKSLSCCARTRAIQALAARIKLNNAYFSEKASLFTCTLI